MSKATPHRQAGEVGGGNACLFPPEKNVCVSKEGESWVGRDRKSKNACLKKLEKVSVCVRCDERRERRRYACLFMLWEEKVSEREGEKNNNRIGMGGQNKEKNGKSPPPPLLPVVFSKRDEGGSAGMQCRRGRHKEGWDRIFVEIDEEVFRKGTRMFL